jgi:hypothetical protein
VVPDIDIIVNEIYVAGLCAGYYRGQEHYRVRPEQDDLRFDFAQNLKGAKSLSEQTHPKNEGVGLVSRTMGLAEGEPGQGPAFNGYRFKILKAQGDKAPGGKMSYMQDGFMTLGHALIAYPAEYGKSGRNTFAISRAGSIYQKDLGAETHKLVEKTTEYNPDESWTLVRKLDPTPAPRKEDSF